MIAKCRGNVCPSWRFLVEGLSLDGLKREFGMAFLGILVLGAISDRGMRSVLFILLVLAVVFLVAGAVLALVALRKQRKVGGDVATLEELENEAS
jgi:hypothetical protein